MPQYASYSVNLRVPTTLESKQAASRCKWQLFEVWARRQLGWVHAQDDPDIDFATVSRHGTLGLHDGKQSLLPGQHCIKLSMLSTTQTSFLIQASPCLHLDVLDGNDFDIPTFQPMIICLAAAHFVFMNCSFAMYLACKYFALFNTGIYKHCHSNSQTLHPDRHPTRQSPHNQSQPWARSLDIPRRASSTESDTIKIGEVGMLLQDSRSYRGETVGICDQR